MVSPKVLVLRAPGTNCDVETAEAWRRAGGEPERVHVNRLLESPATLAEYQVLSIPGGFSYGDDLGAGRVLGSQFRERLANACREFRDAGKLVLGICNGFQVLTQTGLLDLEDDRGATATLAWNNNGRFEARWVHLTPGETNCVFLADVGPIELPIAHAEGRFVARDDAALASLRDAGRIALRYSAADGSPPDGYPANPNGAVDNIAGVTDATGRVLGLMPHPERFIDGTQHPRWTRRAAGSGAGGSGDGLRLFENAVRYFR
ncbi:MAG: phosphoribosylformylglycinamidine synthase I [Planctomycetota bacterium]